MDRHIAIFDTLAIDGWAVTFGTARRGCDSSARDVYYYDAVTPAERRDDDVGMMT